MWRFNNFYLLFVISPVNTDVTLSDYEAKMNYWDSVLTRSNGLPVISSQSDVLIRIPEFIEYFI